MTLNFKKGSILQLGLQILIVLISTWSLGALIWLMRFPSLAVFDSQKALHGPWLQLTIRLGMIWFYWLGGAAYIVTSSLLNCAVVNIFGSKKIGPERWVAVLFLAIGFNLLCQMAGVGSYGTMPGGGVVGVWFVTWPLPEIIWLAIAKSLLLAGMILYTELNLMWLATPVLNSLRWLARPFQVWLNSITVSSQILDLNQVKDLNKTLLEHEYAELLAELDDQVHSNQFWENYYPKSGATNLEFFSATQSSITPESARQEPCPLPEINPDGARFAKSVSKLTPILQEQALVLENKLQRFGIAGEVTAIRPGPVVTLFEFTPAEDAKISKIIALESDLTLALQTASLRIIAPVPGKAVVGFEVANQVRESVLLSDVLQDQAYIEFTNKVREGASTNLPFQIPIAIGKDTVGNNVILDLARAPHLLVAGSTGSGKSVALNSILVSMLCANPPERLRLILIDPKRLEFARYADLGHLLFPIVFEVKKALLVLRWVVRQMEWRYQKMAAAGARSLAEYNQKIDPSSILPYIVIVIDELADLMMTSTKEVEDLIIRIAQMARAAGIHLIVATQRPSVDVVTGLIKVNFPSRISFRVASKADSRTILDCNGADTLLGAGDMLMLNSQSASLQRLHGAYVTDDEIIKVVDFVAKHYPVNYLPFDDLEFAGAIKNNEDEDELLTDVLLFLKDCDEVSISLLQRRFRIGYNRSARIMDHLESCGYVLNLDNGKVRKVIKDRLE